MNDEKWIIELTNKKQQSGGANNKISLDDLDRIASTTGISKENLLNGNVIKDIHIEQIKVWTDVDWIKAVQFTYKFTYKAINNDNNRIYLIEGNRIGDSGGSLTATIDLLTNEYLLNVFGNYVLIGNSNYAFNYLYFSTYMPEKGELKTYGPFGTINRGIRFSFSAPACFFGAYNNVHLRIFGIYKGKITSSSQQEKTELQDQLTGNQTIINNLQSELNNANSQLTAWKTPFFWPQLSWNQPDSAITFRTQLNSFDLAGTTALCFLARHLYRKYRNSRPTPQQDEERQPLLNHGENIQNIKAELRNSKGELNQKKSQPDNCQTQAQVLQRENYSVPGSSRK